MANDVPTFNLKAVVRETGLKPDTIRAWERRYGVPKPRRTSGGHRMYSQHDIDLLKWMNARQHEGLSISRSVDLWKSLEAEGKDPLQVTSHTRLRQSMPLGDRGELANLRQDWIRAGLNFDEPRAEQTLTQAFALFPLNSVVLDVMLPGEMTGVDICQRLRSQPDTAHVLVVMLSALSDRTVHQAAFAAGAHEFWHKPVPLSEFSMRLETMMAKADATLDVFSG